MTRTNTNFWLQILAFVRVGLGLSVVIFEFYRKVEKVKEVERRSIKKKK
jgi:hypothetical protein